MPTKARGKHHLFLSTSSTAKCSSLASEVKSSLVVSFSSSLASFCSSLKIRQIVRNMVPLLLYVVHNINDLTPGRVGGGAGTPALKEHCRTGQYRLAPFLFLYTFIEPGIISLAGTFQGIIKFTPIIMRLFFLCL